MSLLPSDHPADAGTINQGGSVSRGTGPQKPGQHGERKPADYAHRGTIAGNYSGTVESCLPVAISSR